MAKDKVNLEPLNDRILIEKFIPEAVSKVGIVIPERARETENRAKVAAVPDKFTALKVGDVVVVAMYGGTELKVDGKDYLLISFSDILARVKN